MNLDTSSSSAHRRSQAASSMSMNSPSNIPLPYSNPSSAATSPHLSGPGSLPLPLPYRHSIDEEMVDIDLEGGKAEPFGSPHMSEEEFQRQSEEEKLSMAGLEHRRSPLTSPQLVSTMNSFSRPVSPSPLGMESISISNPYDEPTPRAPSRDGGMGFATVPPAVMAATHALRRPPPVATSSNDSNGNGIGSYRSVTPEGSEREQEVIRGFRRVSMPRGQRESSIVSEHSEDGLLAGEREGERDRWRMSTMSNSTDNSGSGGGAGNSRQSSPRARFFDTHQHDTAEPTLSSFNDNDKDEGPLATPTASTFINDNSYPLGPPALPPKDDDKPEPPPALAAVAAPMPKQQPTHTKSSGSIVAARKKALEDAMQEVNLDSAGGNGGLPGTPGKRGSRVMVGKR